MITQGLHRLLRKEPLLFAVVLAVAAGMASGAILRGWSLTARQIELVGLLGELMIRSLKMLVLPLVGGCMVTSVCALGEAGSGMERTAAWALGLFLIMTSISAGLGVILAVVIHPGHAGDLSSSGLMSLSEQAVHQNQSKMLWPVLAVVYDNAESKSAEQPKSPVDALLKLLRDLVPDNIAAAATEMNLLGIIFFSVCFGVALSLHSSNTGCRQIMASIAAFNEVIITMVTAVIYTSPVGIASLIAANLCKIQDLAGTVRALGTYIGVYLAGLAIICLVMYPLVYWACARQSPIQLYRAFATALVTVFGTDSSIATLPVTLRCATSHGISNAVAQFVIPLGANINMNGTSFFESFTVIFIAQAHGVELDLGQYVVISTCAVLAAISAAAIPSAGLVTMVMVMQAANLDAYLGDIGIIFALDWFLDRCRSIPNVLGDGVTAAIVQSRCSQQLEVLEEEDIHNDALQQMLISPSSQESSCASL